MNDNLKFVALIPSYKPDEHLIRLVEELNKESISCLVVDDGSGEKYRPVYDKVERSTAKKNGKHWRRSMWSRSG